jgi:hypothetical protein
MNDLDALKAAALEAKKYQASQAKIYWVNTAQELADAVLMLSDRLEAFKKDFIYLDDDEETVLTPREALDILEEKLRTTEGLLAVATDALKFYATRKHLEINNQDDTILNYDHRYPEWRIGPPYLKSAEFGQKAKEALAKIGIEND